jgi:hypothetical protein
MKFVRPSRLAFGSHLRMRLGSALQQLWAAWLPASMPDTTSLILRCEPKASLEGRTALMQPSSP